MENSIHSSKEISQPEIDKETDAALDEEIKKLFERSIVLFNDDHNTFEHVITCLIKYCKHNPHQAEQCALIVHNSGKCKVKNGSFDDLKPICEALLEAGLTAEIQ